MSSEHKSDIRLDGRESAFFERQLEIVKSKTYDARYPELKALKFIPVNTEGNIGADTITFRRFDQVGVAKVVADYAKDFPRIDIYGEEQTVKIKMVGGSYGYSLKEIRRASMANLPLEMRKSLATRKAIETKLDKMALKGDTAYNIQGLITYPGIQEFVPSGSDATAKKWTNKTVDQILGDIKGAITQVQQTTNGVENPDTLLLPLAQYNILAFTKVNNDATKTILTFIKENYPQLTTIDWLIDLKDAGGSGVDRAMLFKSDAEHLTFELPLPYEQHSPQQKGLEFEVICDAETAGVIVYYPLSVIKMDGI